MAISISGDGSFTGLSAAETYSFDGAVSIAGTVTYEDVTNIDSVGVVTARSGVYFGSPGSGTQVDGNSTGIGIGTDNPLQELHIYSNGGAYAIIQSSNSGSNTGILFGDSDNYQIGSIIYENANDALKFSTNGENERLRIDSSGNVGIGTDNPSELLHCFVTGDSDGALFERGDASGTIRIQMQSGDGSSAALRVNDGGDNLGFYLPATGSTADVTIDSSGRLLVGTNTSLATDRLLQVADTGSEAGTEIIRYADAASSAPVLALSKSRGTSVGVDATVANNDTIGYILFKGNNGTSFLNAAWITCEVDGEPNTGGDTTDMPGRLVFSTTADGASSATERMKIGSDSQITMTNPNSSNTSLFVNCTAGAFVSGAVQFRATRAQNSAYQFLTTTSSSGTDTEHNLRGDGNAYADGSWNGGGADYAEYFEWSDGNTTAEDRRGISVVLDGDKIREAVVGEDPIGVISDNPSVVGDADIDRWKGKYLRDDFGTYVLEGHNVVSWTETIIDEEGNETSQYHSYEDWNIPEDVIVPADATISATDDDGNAFTHRKLNPDYNPNTEYVSRENRPEWDTVGLMGKLRIRKGQVTGARWIKMRDVSDSVEEWLVR